MKPKSKYYINFSLIFVLFVTVSLLFSCKKNSSKPVPEPNTQKKTEQAEEDGIKPENLKFMSDTAVFSHYAFLNTSFGKIKIGLYGEDAPKTVNNFVELASKGRYINILFHRVAKNFLIQTGDPNTRSAAKKGDWGHGGKSTWNKDFEDELNPKTPSYRAGYFKGIVAMANRGPNTNSSQFFICLEEAKYLEPKWTIFGKVVDGIDIVEKISMTEIEPGPFEQNDGTPKKPVKLYSVSVVKAK